MALPLSITKIQRTGNNQFLFCSNKMFIQTMKEQLEIKCWFFFWDCIYYGKAESGLCVYWTYLPFT